MAGAPAAATSPARRTSAPSRPGTRPRSISARSPSSASRSTGAEARACAAGARPEPGLAFAAARLCLLAVLLGEDRRRRDRGGGRLELVLPAGDDVALAFQHGLEAGLRDVGGVGLRALADGGVHHVGA